MLLTNTQVLRLCRAFANGSSANVKLSESQLYKKGQSGGFLDRHLGPLIKSGLSVVGNVLEPLAKKVLIPLRLTEAASATDAAIHKKMFASGMIALIISNEEMNDIMKIVKFLKKSDLLIKVVSKTIKNETKEEKANF